MIATDHAAIALETAARHYYWKPYASYFAAYELRAYLAAAPRFESPMLDLGCSDTTFGQMLSEIIPLPGKLIGFDLDRLSLQQAKQKGLVAFADLIQADTTHIPFASNSFSSAVANGVLPAVGAGLDRTLSEICRIIRPGGRFLATVPTPLLAENYILRRVLTSLRLRRLAAYYTRITNRRMYNLNSFNPQEWTRRFEEAGLSVDRVIGFFSPRATRTWSALTFTPLRINGVLKLFPIPALHRSLATIHRALFAGSYYKTPAELPPDECSYLLIVAHKTGVPDCGSAD